MFFHLLCVADLYAISIGRRPQAVRRQVRIRPSENKNYYDTCLGSATNRHWALEYY